MIYSVDFFTMTENLNPLAVCRYLDETGWEYIPLKRNNIKIYQYERKDIFEQVNVPISKELIDYKQAMYNVVKTISDIEKKSVEQIMLYLLNPNTDILKIRLSKQNIESGTIMFDDAIRLYDNAKKLLAATALDIINPKKIHYGRIDEPVQSFLNQCRFGQTEIGSYVVSVICPFAELSDTDEYKQLSIFSDEEQCANSLTRKVTNKLMDNIAYIKNQIDNGEEKVLSNEDVRISSNFFEALNGMDLQSENMFIEFTTEWAPAVKRNRSINNHIKISNDYYQPIKNVIDCIKDKTAKRTEIIGRIKQLSASPIVDKRKDGKIVVVYIDDNNKAKSITVNLQKEDYENAVKAHQYGKTVKVIGDLEGKNRLKMNNTTFFVYD